RLATLRRSVLRARGEGRFFEASLNKRQPFARSGDSPMTARLAACLGLLVAAAPAPAQPPNKDLPKVVLVGECSRLGYAPLVAKRLEGKAVVVSVAANGGDSANVLKNLDEWVLREKPDVVHLNCGLHDLKLSKKTKKHQVELDDYEANLKRI